MIDKNLQSLQKLLSVLDTEAMTPDMFATYFEKVIAFVKENRDLNKKEIQDFQKLFEKAHTDLVSGNENKFKLHKKEIQSLLTEQLSKMASDFSSDVSSLENRVTMLENEELPSEESITQNILSKIPPQAEIVEETPEQTRDKLETLDGENRLDISAIKGLESIKKDPQGGLQLVGGTAGIKLYVGGVKKGTAKTLNIIAGSGVSITYAAANGRNDITISASGTALSILTATGAIDNTNKAFTFLSKPNIVIVNGASYQENKGWAWNGGSLTATLDNPVGIGGDIYGL